MPSRVWGAGKTISTPRTDRGQHPRRWGLLFNRVFQPETLRRSSRGRGSSWKDHGHGIPTAKNYVGGTGVYRAAQKGEYPAGAGEGPISSGKKEGLRQGTGQGDRGPFRGVHGFGGPTAGRFPAGAGPPGDQGTHTNGNGSRRGPNHPILLKRARITRGQRMGGHGVRFSHSGDRGTLEFSRGLGGRV